MITVSNTEGNKSNTFKGVIFWQTPPKNTKPLLIIDFFLLAHVLLLLKQSPNNNKRPKSNNKARTDLGGEEYFPMFLFARLKAKLPLSAAG
jgi:hypothetical protein